jgi:transposase
LRSLTVLISETAIILGSLKSWSQHKFTLEKQFRETHPPSKYGLTAKLYERTLYKCLDEIHAYHEAIKTAVVKEIYQKTTDELERQYYLYLLSHRFWIDLNTKRAKWLHRIIRKHFHRGHTWVRNQIVYNVGMYSCKRRGNKSYLELATLKKGKRISLPLHGNPDIRGEIKVIIQAGNRVEIHYPVKVLKLEPTHPPTKGVGVDRGFTEVYVDSEGKFYGSGFGKLIQSEVSQRVERGRKRGKLHSLAQKYERLGLHSKAQNIRKNNLGLIKMNRQKRVLEGRLKTLVFTATVQLFTEYATVYYEDLTEPIKDKKGLKGRTAAKMSAWCKGTVKKALEQVSARLSGQAKAVNAAYTSQVDHRYGVLLGERKADSFHCFDGVVLQSDVNAARNILARKDDAEISQYMKFTKVKSILLGRTELFLEQRQRETAKTLDSQEPVLTTGIKGEQLNLFDITLTHSESEVQIIPICSD